MASPALLGPSRATANLRYIPPVSSSPRVIGIAGWSGSGKTTLISRLIPELATVGLRVATLKHAHHSFDLDQPGKDSQIHRQAGAIEVIISSPRRWAQLHEIKDGTEVPLEDLLRRVSPVDLILIEGWKARPVPRLEVWRGIPGAERLWPKDPNVVAVASLVEIPGARVPVLPLDDIVAIAKAVLDLAVPLETVLTRLRG